ncbi:MAG: hypothetical protein H6742_03740 [Alphaproteobacteria bacterium]|nr:hypothetical protein [Alphaproteobacteria bacterium]
MLPLPRHTLRAPAALVLVAGAAALSTGCWGRGAEYEGGTPQDTAPVETSECGEDLDLEAGINISGVALDLQTGQPLTVDDSGGTPLCVAAIDPAPAVTGGDPAYLIVSTLCDDGSFVLAGLEEVPSIGVMVGVYDCDSQGTVMRTVTGVATEDFDGLGAGDTLEGVTAWSVSADYLATMQTDLGTTERDLGAEGFLAGFVTDSSGAAVGGASVTCGACGDRPTFYLDGAPDDGLWGAGTSFNTTTSADGGGMFLIPAARITTYTCDDGGTHSWEGNLFGSLPEYAVFIEFDAL